MCSASTTPRARSGSLRAGRFRATVVDGERYLLTLMRYIELNPVRADRVAHLRECPRLSHAFDAVGKCGPGS